MLYVDGRVRVSGGTSGKVWPFSQGLSGEIVHFVSEISEQHPLQYKSHQESWKSCDFDPLNLPIFGLSSESYCTLLSGYNQIWLGQNFVYVRMPIQSYGRKAFWDGLPPPPPHIRFWNKKS